MINDAKTLFYKRSAKNWLEALPLGNGSLGAMIYGRTSDEIIAMNSDTLWSGFPRKTEEKDGATEAFLKARELVMQGDYFTSKKLLEENVLANCSQAYMPLCNIRIQYSKSGFQKNYRRMLDLETGINTVTYTRGSDSFKRQSFVSFNEDAYYDKITCETGKKISFTVYMNTITFMFFSFFYIFMNSSISWTNV
jgi:alpha-L-fucosidase 2